MLLILKDIKNKVIYEFYVTSDEPILVDISLFFVIK